MALQSKGIEGEGNATTERENLLAPQRISRPWGEKLVETEKSSEIQVKKLKKKLLKKISLSLFQYTTLNLTDFATADLAGSV